MLKRFSRSTLKRANEFVFTLEPGATSAGLVTLSVSRVNAARYGGWLSHFLEMLMAFPVS